MDKVQRNTLVTIIVVCVISTGIIVGFSIPLGMFPPLGDLLLPGNGLWLIKEDVVSEETITSPLLTDEVTVYRDQWGIPHIYGTSENDILFALGYVQAQDRLFQMDMARRATQGKLAEIRGSSMLDMDKMALTKLMDYWTNESIKELEASGDPTDQLVLDGLDAFANGVNDYIANEKVLPLEFQFLGIEPTCWAPYDTISFIKYMSEMLTWEYSDFANILIKDAIGMDAYQELYGYPLPYQIPITSDYGSEFDVDIEDKSKQVSDEISEIFVDLSREVYEQIKESPRESQFLEKVDVKGSNNWAANTSTGKPILCNDMHLGFDLPGIWYEAHLVNTNPGSEFNIYGFFLAGVPYPIVGHNSFCGWGMTNTAYDVHDWYFYEGINETHYWYKGAETEYSIIEYEINVKDQDPVTYQIKNTVHGPVFNDLLNTDRYPIYTDKVIACKWIGQSVTFEARAIYEFCHSQNRADFDEASKYFSTPAQNLVYADIHGDYGIRPTGKVPIKNDTGIPAWHLGNGTMVYNGSAGHGEWIGYVPFEDLPHSENPSQGYVFSANQIVAGPDYMKNYTLQNPIDVSDGYRARRITELLSSAEDVDVDFMKSVLLDVYSVKAGNFSSYLLDVVNAIPSKTTLQQNAYDALNTWNFLQEKESYAATIFNLWIEIYKSETFTDDVTDLGSPFLPYTNVLEWFTKNNATSKWFDNINTPTVETRDDIILLAFNKALTGLVTYFGTEDITTWEWGELHQIKIDHLTGLSSLGFGPVPVDGTGSTVSPFSGYHLWDGENVVLDYCGHGSSERMILDFNNLSNSVSIIPSGQRGISNSVHYIDQLLMYLDGEFHTQYFGADTIEKFSMAWVESKIIFKQGVLL
ncbi:MAG: penicillin acylase family protein [Asgard group archaeon]|nr:penicillin acylase family protein [Asgard group archaeon]